MHPKSPLSSLAARTLLVSVLGIGSAGAEPWQVVGGVLSDAKGNPVGMSGVNLFQTHQIWAIRPLSDEDLRRNIASIAREGFNVIRMPLFWDMLEPAPSVYPDHPRFKELMAEYELFDGYLPQLDRLLDLCAEHGLRVIPEFHYPTVTSPSKNSKGKVAWADDHGPILEAHTPKMLGWLAKHWKDHPALLGFEVPWNEPHNQPGVTIPLLEGERYYRFIQACARAIKAEAPHHLVFMAPTEWGSGNIDDTDAWRVPPEVDALFPHAYIGLHTPHPQPVMETGYSAGMAAFLAPYRASGKPLFIGEWGDCMVHKLDPDLEKRSARAIDACKAQWFALGLQGTTWWAWNDGLSSDIDSYRPSVRDSLTPEREALRKWLWLQARGPTANPAKVAVLRNPIIGHSEHALPAARGMGRLDIPLDIRNHDNSDYLGLNPKHWARPGLYTRRPWDFDLELAPAAQARTLRVAVSGVSSTVFDFKQGEEYTFLKNDRMEEAASPTDAAEAPRGPRVVAEFTQAAGEPLRASGRLGYLTDGPRDLILLDEAGGEIALRSGRVHDATPPHNAIMAFLYGITEALLDLNVHPFDVITLDRLAANPDLPARYDAILLDTRNLPAGFAFEGPAFRFDAHIDAPALRAFLAERGVNTTGPGPLLLARNAHGLMVYNRGQTPYTGAISPELPEGVTALVDFDRKDAITPRGQTLHIELEPFQAKVFQFIPSTPGTP